MSLHGAQTKEPLIRMVKRDTMPQKKAWGIRAIAFLLSLVTGGVVILMLGHNPFSVYISMVQGAWGSSTVIHETIKIAVPLLITAIGISFAFAGFKQLESLWMPLTSIGIASFVLSLAGSLIGVFFGKRFHLRVEIFGDCADWHRYQNISRTFILAIKS